MTEEVSSSTSTSTLSRIGARIKPELSTSFTSNPLSFMDRILRPKETRTRQLDEVMDITKDTDIFSNKDLSMMNPRKLYGIGTFSRTSSLLRSQRELDVTVLKDPVTVPLLENETIEQIIRMGRQYAHLGLIIIGLKGLHRKGLGTKAMIVLQDRGFSDPERSTIATMEVDLNNCLALVYHSPNFPLQVRDLNRIQISFLTKGYETFDKQKANLMLFIGFIGKLSDSNDTQYKLRIQGIVDGIASQGTKMIFTMEISSTRLEGQDWDVTKLFNPTPPIKIPQTQNMYQSLGGRISFKFSNYQDNTGTSSNQEQTEEPL